MSAQLQCWQGPKADKVPAKCSTLGSDLTHFLCFPLTFHFFYCCLAALFLLNEMKGGKMPLIKDGKVVYSSLDTGEMVYVNSDSERDDADLAEEMKIQI